MPPLLVADGPVLVFGGPYSNLQVTEALSAAAARLGIPPRRMICTGDVAAYGADAADCGCGSAAGSVGP